MKQDPELHQKLLGMGKDELLAFFEKLVSQSAISPLPAEHASRLEAEANLSQVREYMRLRMTH